MGPDCRRRGVLLGAVGAVLLAAAGVGAYAVADGASVSNTGAMRRLVTDRRPGQFARSYGLNPAEAVTVFTLRKGQTVRVVGDPTAECLIRGNAGQTAEMCDSTAAIKTGEVISVLDECGSSGNNEMEIIGLAPPDVTNVRLLWSDGSRQGTDVTHGAFRFDGTNPAPGAAYPTGVSWLRGSSQLGEAGLPVRGNEFCLPAS